MKRKVLDADVLLVRNILDKAGMTEEITEIHRLGGMTNRSYHVTLANTNEYVVRIPGDGTEELIVRDDEKKSKLLACELGIDTDLYYFDDLGRQVSLYIDNAMTMTPALLRESKHIAEVAAIFRTLHTSDRDTGVSFEVFEMAEGYENFLFKNHVALYDDYEAVKQAVMDIKHRIDAQGEIQKVPCHNDSLCENWVYGKDRLYLVDWEYAGMNDAMWDLADVSIEAFYEENQDRELLQDYFGRPATAEEEERFLANKIYLDYLWTLWGLTRVPFDGQDLQDYADERYKRLKKTMSVMNRKVARN